MRRLGDTRCVERLLLQCQEPLRQPIELLSDLLDHLPLLRNLVGQLLDCLRLIGDRLLECRDAALLV